MNSQCPRTCSLKTLKLDIRSSVCYGQTTNNKENVNFLLLRVKLIELCSEVFRVNSTFYL